jgi:transposase
MLLAGSIPAESGVQVDTVTVVDGVVVVAVRPTRAAVPCPACGRLARRVHSHYRRTITDLPWQGVPVRLDLHARRFRCDAPTCPQRVFAARFPGLVAPGARRGVRLTTLYLSIGLALGGEAGGRLVADLGLCVSPDTLLRLTTAAPLAAAPTPRVLGVDDWSWRKGRRWGTILVDLERHRTIDILPDRQAETFARWLREHPGVEVISRDRGGAYADGGRHGAPEAVQVADRFHLVKNAGEVLERVVQRHHAALREAATAVDREAAANDTAPPMAEPAVPAPAPTTRPRAAAPRRVSQAHQLQQATQARRRARYEEVVGLTRQTVARWLRAGGFPERAPARPRRQLIDKYEPYLRERWQAGCQNARQLWREVREQGFTGGHETVRRLVVRWRTAPGRPGLPPRQPRVAPAAVPPPAPPKTRPWSPRQARWVLVKPAEALRPEQRAYLRHLGERAPAILTGQRLAVEFLRLVRERDEAALAPWLAAAATSGLADFVEFAKGVERDRAAVEAALTTPWSNGQTEARVLQLKAVRRQMRGRGGLALVRRRVVKAA